jgi:hypothetical protein
MPEGRDGSEGVPVPHVQGHGAESISRGWGELSPLLQWVDSMTRKPLIRKVLFLYQYKHDAR